MDAEKSKTAVIVILIILNAVIFYFVSEKNSAFTLTAAQESAIVSLLEKNRISPYVNGYLKDFSPLKRIETELFDYMSFETALFGEDENKTYTEDFQGLRITSETGRMSVYSGELLYYNAIRNMVERDRVGVTEDEAKAFCDGFIANMFGDAGPDFTFIAAEKQEYSYSLLYYGLFGDMKIVSNMIRFLVDDRGLVELTCHMDLLRGYTGLAREIYSVDEALLILIQEVKSLLPNKDIILTGMEMVYYAASDKSGGDGLAAPCYMFSIREQGSGTLETRIFIDAYTNTAVNIEHPLLTN